MEPEVTLTMSCQYFAYLLDKMGDDLAKEELFSKVSDSEEVRQIDDYLDNRSTLKQAQQRNSNPGVL